MNNSDKRSCLKVSVEDCLENHPRTTEIMESPGGPKGHSCQCSSSGSEDHTSNYSSRRGLNNQDLPENMDMSQKPFIEQIGRFDNTFQRIDERGASSEYPGPETHRRGHGAYSSRNMNLARSLVAEISHRAQESLNRQENSAASVNDCHDEEEEEEHKTELRNIDEYRKRHMESSDGNCGCPVMNYSNDPSYKQENYPIDEFVGYPVHHPVPSRRHNYSPRKASLKMSKMAQGHGVHSPTFSHLHPTSSGSQTSPRSSPMITDGHCSSPNSHYRGNSGSDVTARCENEKDELTSHERRLLQLSGASSSSSLLNHGSSSVGHQRQGNPVTAPLMGYHQETSSSNSNVNPHQHYHHRRRRHHSRRPGSSLYYESSGVSTSSNTCRTHSRSDHVHEHRHPHPPQRTPQSPPFGDRRPREGVEPAMLAEYHNQHHSRAADLNQYNQTEETKSGALVDIDAGIQEMSPCKSKCQCHMMQPMEHGKKQLPDESIESEDGNGHIAMRQHQPPALPPRPPPRPNRLYETPTSATHQRHPSGEGGCCKKYVVLCCFCGGMCTAVGSLFMAIHAVLSAHTASLDLFETLPSYVPGAMLILMGLLTMILSKRKHRYGILMKVCGVYGIFCALICLFVTVTTTVTHLSRLQGLRECVYTSRARSCTCYGTSQAGVPDTSVIFEGTPHCEAVHGALYSCLCALFGVSVAGILACIFSCMLVYQLLTHEKKKMYWEQLELRCRSYYGQGVGAGDGGAVVGARQAGSCGCCNDCGGAGAWWAQTPGNLYTPNPDLVPSRRWRLPWSRSRGPAPSPDSNYGFHTQVRQSEVNAADNRAGPYSVLGSQNGPYSVLQGVNHGRATYATNPASGAYGILDGPVPLWGPPPPYSDPNSPARRPTGLVQVPVPETRTRTTKRLQDNLEVEEVDYGRTSVLAKRPFENYENAEDLATITDTVTEVERTSGKGTNGCANDDGTVNGETARTGSRRSKKLLLRGVENGAFQQQEATSGTKQSESELYFGDVSSCCGPESSIYDLAVDKEGDPRTERQEMGSNYHSSRRGKRQSARSRQPFPFARTDVNNEVPSNSSYSSMGDESGNAAGHSSHADTQYEIIQQGHYGYYDSAKVPEVAKSESLSPSRVTQTEAIREDKDAERNDEYCDYREKPRRIDEAFPTNPNEDWEREGNARTIRDEDDNRSVEV